MAKGDDAKIKKKNKASRKKLKKDPSTVSVRIAGIIASKKRRKAGKRRICEGMCFSLPTPEDPFNERHAKKDFSTKKPKNLVPSQADRVGAVNKKSDPLKKENIGKNLEEHQKQKKQKIMNMDSDQKETCISIDKLGHKNSECPSKFLIMCLNSIEKALRHDDTFSREEDKHLFVNAWGVDFWKYFSVGNDILETSGTCSTAEQIAWMVSTAADTIARKEKEGVSFASPFLLFLVPSREKASKVRSVCKPLKALGLHTVSLHPGASIDHQIEGLKSCEPEFLVSTPERLLELVSLKAIDISGVSLLVVDELEATSKVGHLDMINSIRQSISGNPITVVFNDCPSFSSLSVVQNLLTGSICRLSVSDSVTSASACIVQSVLVCASEEKIAKGMEVLHQACVSNPKLKDVLIIASKDTKCDILVTTLKSNGYSVSTDAIHNNRHNKNRKERPRVSLIDVEHFSTVELAEYEGVIILDFAFSVDNYVQILTRMARQSVHGFLQSIFTKENALVAPRLIQILEQCGQAVPEDLRNLCPTSSGLEQ